MHSRKTHLENKCSSFGLRHSNVQLIKYNVDIIREKIPYASLKLNN
jgi:hypothetical protein